MDRSCLIRLSSTHTKRSRQPWRATIVVLAFTCVWQMLAAHPRPLMGEELAQRALWQPPSDDTLLAWLETTHKALDLPRALAEFSPSGVSSHEDRINAFCRQLGLMDPRFQAVYSQCQQPMVLPLVAPAVLDDDTIPVAARANLRLLYGRWLAASMLLDESLNVLQDLPTDTVVDPAALLFYRGVALYQLGRIEESLANLSELRSNPEAVPQRFATVAGLMEDDLKQSGRHQLDPVARLMDRVQIRLGHARAGTRVRQDESEVIKQLDELIDKIEEQLQASRAAAQQSQGAGGANPSNPAQDSFRARPQGVGDVTPRDLPPGGDWGNLPPKERERALQQLSKDFPSHYREIVERYFRKLAQDRNSTP